MSNAKTIRRNGAAVRLSSYNRTRKFKAFMELLRPDAATRVLDVGYTGKEYHETDNYLEKHYPYPGQITALGIEDSEDFSRRYPQVTAVRYEGRKFPFEAQAFDVCWSNAVLEHVGGWDAQVLFLKEIHRVARKAFVTTPNKHFPVELHTRTPLLHYLPKPWFEGYLRRTGKSWAAGSYMNLLSPANVRELLAEAGIQQYTLVKNKLLGFTVDIVIVLDEVAPLRPATAAREGSSRAAT